MKQSPSRFFLIANLTCNNLMYQSQSHFLRVITHTLGANWTCLSCSRLKTVIAVGMRLSFLNENKNPICAVQMNTISNLTRTWSKCFRWVSLIHFLNATVRHLNITFADSCYFKVHLLLMETGIKLVSYI